MLRGLLSTMSAWDLLDWAERRSIEGVISCERGTVNRRLVVAGGHLIKVSSSHPAEHLSRVLVGAGYLTEDQLAGLARAGEPLGRQLVEKELVAEDDLRAVLELKIVEPVYELLSWSDGSFSFEAGVPEDRGEIGIAVPIRTCLDEGEERVLLWHAVRERIPDDDTRFTVKAYKGTANELIQDVARGLSVREIMLERRWLPFPTYRALAELAERGAIEVLPLGPAGSPARLAAAARSLLGRPTVPRLARTPEELGGLDLSAAERALLARVDGRWDSLTLIRTAQVGEVEALVALERLSARGLIWLEEHA